MMSSPPVSGTLSPSPGATLGDIPDDVLAVHLVPRLGENAARLAATDRRARALVAATEDAWGGAAAHRLVSPPAPGTAGSQVLARLRREDGARRGLAAGVFRQVGGGAYDPHVLPAPSRDGSTVAVHAGAGAIDLLTPGGTLLRRLHHDKDVIRLDWSADGRALWATSADGLALLDAEAGTTLRSVPVAPAPGGLVGLAWARTAISPDGRHLALLGAGDGLVLEDLVGGGRTAFVGPGREDALPAHLLWSPRGGHLLVLRNFPRRALPAERYSRDEGFAVAHPFRSMHLPSWSADERVLAYYDGDGVVLRELAGERRWVHRARAIGSDWSADGRFCLVLPKVYSEPGTLFDSQAWWPLPGHAPSHLDVDTLALARGERPPVWPPALADVAEPEASLCPWPGARHLAAAVNPGGGAVLLVDTRLGLELGRVPVAGLDAWRKKPNESSRLGWRPDGLGLLVEPRGRGRGGWHLVTFGA